MFFRRQLPVKLKFRKNRRAKSSRADRGVYMVEVLVAMSIGGIIAFAMLDTLCGSMRTMGTTSNEAYAQQIADQLVEHSRAYGYTRLQNYQGTHILLLNKVNQGETGPAVDKRPLLLDLVGKQWRAKTQAGAFTNGAISYTILNGPPAKAVTVIIVVSWTDGLHQNMVRSTSRQFVLFDQS